MKLYMRLPKRGFTNQFRKEYNEINVDTLAKFAAGTRVDVKLLEDHGLIRWPKLPVKLLGRGKLEIGLDVIVHHASASAKAAVEKAGGTLRIVETKR